MYNLYTTIKAQLQERQIKVQSLIMKYDILQEDL